ncbi:MAG: CHAT domain-containing protein [Phycisphaeraceae bacterium]|nr:MAG: CHAT domain-containing protein [Phycisphaeraceae bacterium]
METRTLQDALDAARCVGWAAAPGDVADVRFDRTELLEAVEAARDMAHQDLDRSLVDCNVLCILADRDGDPGARARARSAFGHALNYANRFDEASKVTIEGAEIAHSAGDAVGEARARMTLVHTYARLGRLGKALVEALEARALFDKAGETGWAAKTDMNAGIIRRMQGDHAGAVDLFRRSLAFEGHNAVMRAQIRNNLGEALLDAGDFMQAEREFRASADTLEGEQAWRLAAIGRGNLADLLGRQGRLPEALQEFERARRYFENDSATGELGRILTEQADVLRLLGATDEACAAYRRAYALLVQAGLRAEQARALLGLGAAVAEDDPECARGVLDEASTILEELGNHTGLARSDVLRARAELAAGNPEGALRLAEGVADRTAGNPADASGADAVRAEALIALGRSADAVLISTNALGQTELAGMPDMRASLLRVRAAAYRGVGNANAALADLRAGVDAIDRARSALGADRYRAAITHQRRGVYQELVGLLLEQEGPEATAEAFSAAERARCRGLIDQLDTGAVSTDPTDIGDDAELVATLQDHRRRLSVEYSRFDPAKPHTDESWRNAVRASEHAITAMESRLASSRVGRALGLETPTPEMLSACLSDREAVVAYWWLPDCLVAFVVRDTGITGVRLIATSDETDAAVESALFQIRRGLTRPSEQGSGRRRGGVDRALRSLGELVWDGLEGTLEGVNRVTVVPTGVLHAVPFACVRTAGYSLVERYEVSTLPSAELLSVMRARPAAGTSEVIVGVPDRAAPQIESEAAAISAVLPGGALLEGESADWETVRAHASHARLLHLACHGTHQPDAPLASAIRLADRWVTARDVMDLKLPGSVVVLSGCDTGRVGASFGDDVHGLVRAFVVAGAGALVTTLWPAHDRATRELIEDLYAHASSNAITPGGVRRGLAAAQRTRIHAGLHPAHWAHLTYVGG